MTTTITDDPRFGAPLERSGIKESIDSLVTSSEEMRILFRQIGMGVNTAVRVLEHQARVNSPNIHMARIGALAVRDELLAVPRIHQPTTISMDPTVISDSHLTEDPMVLQANIRTTEANHDLLVQFGCTPLARRVSNVAMESWMIKRDSRGYNWLITPYVIPIIDTLSERDWPIIAKLVSNLQNMSMIRLGLYPDPELQVKESSKLKLIGELYRRGDRELSGNFILIEDMTPKDPAITPPKTDHAILSAREIASSVCDFDPDAVIIYGTQASPDHKQETTLLGHNLPLGLNAVFTKRLRRTKIVSGYFHHS